uniref:Uncharacterized protein n=1 Tax=Rhizophora mucronata TaxID=61149 RepID=A0A2P2QAA8_RHIMU
MLFYYYVKGHIHFMLVS